MAALSLQEKKILTKEIIKLFNKNMTRPYLHLYLY